MTPLASPEQVADFLNLEPREVCRLAKDGKLPSYRLSKKVIRFDMGEVMAWMEKHKIEVRA